MTAIVVILIFLLMLAAATWQLISQAYRELGRKYETRARLAERLGFQEVSSVLAGRGFYFTFEPEVVRISTSPQSLRLGAGGLDQPPESVSGDPELDAQWELRALERQHEAKLQAALNPGARLALLAFRAKWVAGTRPSLGLTSGVASLTLTSSASFERYAACAELLADLAQILFRTDSMSIANLLKRQSESDPVWSIRDRALNVLLRSFPDSEQAHAAAILALYSPRPEIRTLGARHLGIEVQQDGMLSLVSAPEEVGALSQSDERGQLSFRGTLD